MFKSVFAFVTGRDITTSEFEEALDVIRNNDEIRPKEPSDLATYLKFLVDNLPTTSNPNRVLNVINTSFSRISAVNELVKNAQKNQACDTSLLATVAGKFIKNTTSIESAAAETIEICSHENSGDVIRSAFIQIPKHKVADIFDHIAQTLDSSDTSTIRELVGLAGNNADLSSAITLILRCLELSLEQVNQTGLSIEIIREINNLKNHMSDSKKDLTRILRKGFVSTSSDSLKESILGLVSSMKIKGPFKKNLPESDLEFYNKWIS